MIKKNARFAAGGQKTQDDRLSYNDWRLASPGQATKYDDVSHKPLISV
jgi:hypothetical protein